MRIYLESLGCPKNLVDSQSIMRLLEHLGHVPVGEPRQAQVLIVNTCGFIEDARAESIAELHELARRKGSRQVLVAAGCLAQYWGQDLIDEVPGVDAVLGTRRWAEIDALARETWARRGHQVADPLLRLGNPDPGTSDDESGYAVQGASAYLKIAEGCSAPCAFCAIPAIKGPAASRPVGAIVADAVKLVEQGVREIVLIAQDTTAYGRDRGERDALPGLVEAILETVPKWEPSRKGVAGLDGTARLLWLRLMYAYPGRASQRLLEVMASDRRICHYLDLPLQHADPAVLRRMKRPSDMERTRRFISQIRDLMPDVVLRTSFIVGYPGETEAEFQALLDFAAEIRFDRMGVFRYSPEEGTEAAKLPGAVADEVKEERYARLMELQQEISAEVNHAQVGRTLDVLVEGRGEGLGIGRSYRDAPEIDGLVLFPDPGMAPGPREPQLEPGTVIPVRITGAMQYDLMGEVASL